MLSVIVAVSLFVIFSGVYHKLSCFASNRAFTTALDG